MIPVQIKIKRLLIPPILLAAISIFCIFFSVICLASQPKNPSANKEYMISGSDGGVANSASSDFFRFRNTPLSNISYLFGIIIFCGVIASLFIFILILNATLNKKNRIKTEALQRELARRIETEAQLRDSKELLSNIIEFLPDATFVIDHNKKVIAWNRALEVMTDTSKEDMLGKGNYEYSIPFYNSRRPILIDSFDKEDNEIECMYNSVERKQKNLIAEKYIQKLYKGKGAYVWGTAAPFCDKSGNFSGAIETIRDISEQKKSEEELNRYRNHLEELIKERTTELNREIADRKEVEKKLQFEMTQRRQVEEQRKKLLEDLVRTNAELQDFAYVVSHDLKAPLRGISSIVTWLSEDYSDAFDEKGREYIDKALIRAKRMYNLIEEILQYSKVGAGKTIPKQLDSQSIFTEVIDSISPSKGISITLCDPLPTIVYDETLFRQVIQNLVGNAVSHMGKPEGEVVVSCKDLGSAWEFCVKDNGVGIEERHHERIFRIFQSLKPHSVDGSTGIGLSLVKKIIERNDGKIRLESQVDKGSSFFFTIPKKLNPGISETGSTILIIDDNTDFTEVVARMLTSSGYKVLSASSGSMAFNIIESCPDVISFVLFDLDIPGEDTMKRYNTIKQMRPEMKIIVCTGLNIEESEFLRHAEIDGVLTKPFTISELNNIFSDNQKGHQDVHSR